MGFNSDLVRFLPGERVSVEVHADSNGDVALRGDGVELSGENEGYTEVQLVEAEGRGVGMLLEDPDDYDSSTTYAANDRVGVATLMLTVPVIMVNTDGGYTSPTVGDHVSWADGGAVQEQTGVTTTGVSTLTNTVGIDANGNLENDSGGDISADLRDGLPFGEVFGTYAREFGQSGKIAVAVYR